MWATWKQLRIYQNEPFYKGANEVDLFSKFSPKQNKTHVQSLKQPCSTRNGDSIIPAALPSKKLVFPQQIFKWYSEADEEARLHWGAWKESKINSQSWRQRKKDTPSNEETAHGIHSERRKRQSERDGSWVCDCTWELEKAVVMVHVLSLKNWRQASLYEKGDKSSQRSGRQFLETFFASCEIVGLKINFYLQRK